jgi:hypothetical protein
VGRAGGKRVRILAVSLAAVTAAGVATAIGTMAHADPSISCTAVKLVAVPGTWETNPSADPNTPVGMLKGVTDRLQQQFGGKVSSYYVPYKSTAFNQGVTYADSEADGVKATRSAMTQIAQACPGTKIVGLGYSQGADVNGDVAAQIGAGHGPIPAANYVAGGNLADPQTGTPGEVNLGVRQPHTQGLLGPRRGYGPLNGKFAVTCLRGDLYCATPNRDKLIRAMGAVGGNIGLTTLQNSAEHELATGLGKKANGQPADLGTLATDVGKLAGQARNGDTTGAARTSNELAGLVDNVQSLTNTVATPSMVQGLLNSPAGSQANQAGQVLRALSRTDLSGLAADLRKAGTAAEQHDLATLAGVAVDAGTKIAPLAGVSPAELAKVTTVLVALRPAALLSQLHNVASITKLDYAGMLRATRSLPAAARSGNTKAVYRALTKIEDRLMPLAKIANRVDFKAIGAALAASPDPNVRAVGDALVILDRVNWVRVTHDLRVIQARMAKLNPKHLPKIDPAHPQRSLTDIFGVNVLSLTGPVADLAQHGLHVAGIKLPDGTVADLMKSAMNPREVIRQGIEIAVFYGSNVHTHYGTDPVDGSGRPAVATLADWLAPRIAAA